MKLRTLKKPVKIELKHDLDHEDIFLHLDEYRIKQVMNNLLNNAIEFTEKGMISIGYLVKTDKELIEIYVKDTGTGIPKNVKEFIFDRFRQADESFTRKHGGTGLGLSISKQLIEMMGGKIWVESEEGKGSIFTFTLPVNTKNN